MGTSIVFDTHKYIKKLTEKGVTEDQAEVHAEAIAGLPKDEPLVRTAVLFPEGGDAHVECLMKIVNHIIMLNKKGGFT